MSRDAAAERFIEAVGRRIRELRLARQLTQERLAEELGTATPHVQAIERGVRNLTLVTLFRVADALNVEPIQILVPPHADSFETKPGRPAAGSGAWARGALPMESTLAEPGPSPRIRSRATRRKTKAPAKKR
ncbi:MAG: helix-turn-helix domain-containing protein [Polyangiaceae bacterium]